MLRRLRTSARPSTTAGARPRGHTRLGGRARRKLVVGLVLAACLSTGVVSAGAVGSTGNSATRGVVLFVGDSNITLAAEDIDWQLTSQAHNENGYVPVMASRIGASIRTADCLDPVGCLTFDYWSQKLATLDGKIEADAIVVNLGINDTLFPGTLTTPGYANYAKKIDWFMGLTGDTPVFWSNLPCSIEPASRTTGCVTIDYALALATPRWPNLTVVDWNKRAGSHFEYITPDDVHYTDAGLSSWTALVLAALDARFPAV